MMHDYKVTVLQSTSPELSSESNSWRQDAKLTAFIQVGGMISIFLIILWVLMSVFYRIFTIIVGIFPHLPLFFSFPLFSHFSPFFLLFSIFSAPFPVSFSSFFPPNVCFHFCNNNNVISGSDGSKNNGSGQILIRIRNTGCNNHEKL